MTEDFIPTRGSRAKNESLTDFKLVTHVSHKSTKTNKFSTSASASTDSKKEEFNIKRAKHEIIKFGMSGFDPIRKEKAEIQLAIKLGAKPPKNRYKNYKVLIKERAKQKEIEKSTIEFQQLGKNSVGKSVAKGKSFDRKRRKPKENLLDVYGQVKVSKKKN